MIRTPSNRNITFAILVAALGYFVDVFDIILFTAVRVPSLKSMGLDDLQITNVGIHLLNIQLFGMLIGGIIWGIYGDKLGRRSILFGSIITYSLANIANGFVTTTGQYECVRFLAGLGLAGELGAGIALINELLSTQKRGLGTMCVAFAGVFGGILGGLAGNNLHWQTAYFVGGGMGLVLLLFRFSLHESPMFQKMKESNVPRGNLKILFKNPDLCRKFFKCVLVGTPMWALIGLFITLSPEIGKELNLTEPVKSSFAILYFNVGLGIGDVASSLLSQIYKSRKKVILGFLLFLITLLASLFFLKNFSAPVFYCFCIAMGFGSGYWAIFLATTSEQFGTNIRATTTVSVPNFTRAMVIPLSLIVGLLKPNFNVLYSVLFVSMIVVGTSIFFIRRMDDTFSRSLEFVE